MSFKLEYLSAGRNQPCAFNVSVNPLILFRFSLAIPLRALADTFFPQAFMTVSRRPFQSFNFPLFHDEKKGITA